ncbi:MAG: hypothetical protein GC150_13380 [Rhizobiales bacterium]|nr:hypothetical protein [Hyphomicrobiales bacterium]
MGFDWTVLWEAVAELAAARFVAETTWAYPALETVHLIGIALLFGPILVFDLRVLGVGRAIAPGRLHAILLPWVWTGFSLNVTSGLLLFASDAAEFATNSAFQAKIALIVLAGLNAIAFRSRFQPWARSLDGSGPAPAGAREIALVSILLWLGVLTAGRLIAYVV